VWQEGDATTVVGTEPGEKGSQFMGEDRREEAPGQEEEEMGLSASATRRERCLEVPKNHHSRFVYTNPACLLTAKGARADEPPHVAFVSRLSCINNNVRSMVMYSHHQALTRAQLTVDVARASLRDCSSALSPSICPG
jgi:hypothetical protein